MAERPPQVAAADNRVLVLVCDGRNLASIMATGAFARAHSKEAFGVCITEPKTLYNSISDFANELKNRNIEFVFLYFQEDKRLIEILFRTSPALKKHSIGAFLDRGNTITMYLDAVPSASRRAKHFARIADKIDNRRPAELEARIAEYILHRFPERTEEATEFLFRFISWLASGQRDKLIGKIIRRVEDCVTM